MLSAFLCDRPAQFRAEDATQSDTWLQFNPYTIGLTKGRACCSNGVKNSFNQGHTVLANKCLADLPTYPTVCRRSTLAIEKARAWSTTTACAAPSCGWPMISNSTLAQDPNAAAEAVVRRSVAKPGRQQGQKKVSGLRPSYRRPNVRAGTGAGLRGGQEV